MSEFYVKDFFMNDDVIDKLFDTASAATDNGDYKAALNNLGDILEHVTEIYGTNDEINDVKTELKDVGSLLEEID